MTGSAISGVIVTPLKQIHDERGTVMHMLRADDPVFQGFGEIYFSSVFPSVVKAWHLHKKMTLNYAVVSGSIKLVLYDNRDDSATRGALQEIILSPTNYNLVTVPPGVWNGFKCVGPETAIVANCATIPHSSDEIERLSPLDPSIPYHWDLVHR